MRLSLLAVTWALPSVLGLAIMPQSPAPVTCAADIRKAGTDLAKMLSKEAIVTFPSNSRWEALLSRSSHPRINPDYSVVIEVGNEEDVQKTLAYANKKSIPFLAVSGAHGWHETLNRLPYGFQVRMRQLNTTTIDAEGKTATVGGGSLQHDVIRSLFAQNKQAVTGLSECVSVIGPTLGGGHSLLQGQHGYALDNLVSARVVLADGSLVEASASENVDLFWALRGAGHNFGIVTSYVVKLYDITTNWTVHQFVYKEDKLEDLFTLINKHEDGSIDRPKELALLGVFTRMPDIDANNPVIAYMLAFQGNLEAVTPYAARFEDIGPISTGFTEDVDYVQLYTVTGNNLDAAVCVENHNLFGSGISLPEWNLGATRTAFNIFANATADSRFNTSSLLIENYGIDGVQKVDADSTGLAPEDRAYPILASPAFWWDGDDEQASKDAHAFAAKIKEALNTPLDNANLRRHTYVNYAMGTEDLTEMYGYESWRLEKLNAAKDKWDKGNAFKFYAPIVEG